MVAAKRSKKRKVEDEDEGERGASDSKSKNKRQKETDVATTRSDRLAELAALEAQIERLQSGLDAARGVLRASRYEPDLDEEALCRVLEYAHRTCYIAAPHGYVPGESQLYMMRPPAPQPMQLQQSILHTLAAGEAGKRQELYNVDKKPDMGVEKDVDSKQEAGKDMLEVLKHMPEMPAGWKPGDPIPGLGKATPGEGAAATKESAKNSALAGNVQDGQQSPAVPKAAPTSTTPKPPTTQAPKKANFALGLEVDDLDSGLGISSDDSGDDSD